MPDAARKNIRIAKNVDFYKRWRLVDEAGTPWVITAAEVYVFDKYDATRASLITLTVVDTDFATGYIALTATAAVTKAVVVAAGEDALVPRWGVWQLDVTITVSGAARKFRLFYGDVELMRRLDTSV